MDYKNNYVMVNMNVNQQLST